MKSWEVIVILYAAVPPIGHDSTFGY